MIKLRFILLNTLLLISFDGFCQKAQIIESNRLMELGSYYYPEQWPESEWERDIKKMSELGFEFTHFGEFAWSTLEPKEGKFCFDWLDKAIELATKYNLKVILCTPSPTPPVWLTQKHPELLIVNEDGRRVQHGARQHASWNSDIYRHYVERIVTIMAKRYANNPQIWGWQIDNEPSHYRSRDYSENARLAFQKWLKNKYNSIEKLNETWGTAFWSQTYNKFEQIGLPNQKELVQRANPHAMLDFKRFSADQAADFVFWQQKLLRKYIPDNIWITTNLMSEYSEVDPLRFKSLDIVTYTKYPAGGSTLGHGEQGFRMGYSNSIGFANDWFRNVNGVTGVMELQPGQVNWGLVNPQTMPGAVRMWIYHAFAGDNKFVCNYRFRQPLSGSEQYHYGIIQPDGVSVSMPGNEYVQVSQELKELRKYYNPSDTMPAYYSARKTAILYSPDNRWEMEYQPQSTQWNYINLLTNYYEILQSFTVPVDVIDESHDFSQYHVLIAPAYQLLDKKLIQRWENYVSNGGHLVLTTRTGQKDREAHLWNEKLSAPIYPLIGARNLIFDMLPESRYGEVRSGNKIYKWNNWADIVDVSDSVEVWAVYNNQYYKGQAGVTHKKIGKGSVTYIGVDSDTGELEKDMLRKVYNQASIEISDLPEGIVIQWCHGFWIAMNYSSMSYDIDIPESSTIILGQRNLKPAEVFIWR